MKKREKVRKAYIGIILIGMLVGLGLFVYDIDKVFLTGKNGLTLYIPDKLIGGSENSLIINTLDDRGKPRSGIDVSVELENNNGTYKLYQGKTDGSGSVQPKFTLPYLNGSAKLIVVAGSERVERNVTIDNTIKIFISTDKPIYQPGQIIHIRTLSFEGIKPKASKRNVTIEIQDPNGNRIFRKSYIPNEFGISYLNYSLSDQLPIGAYKILAIVKYNSDLSAQVQKTVLVKRYVLPKFNIELEGIRSWYTVNEEIEGTISCKYFFGKVVNGSVRIFAKTYYGVSWEEIANGKVHGKLIDGKFNFKIGPIKYAVAIPINKNMAYLELNITITDEAGHKETKSYLITIARVPIIITTLADKNLNGITSTYYIIAQYPDGLPVGNGGFVAYIGEERVEGVLDERGIGKITFNYKQNIEMSIEVKKNGFKASEYFYIKGSSLGIKLIADKTHYRIGEIAKIDAFYKGDSLTAWLYYDVVSKGFVITNGRAELKNGECSIEIPITSEMNGMVEIRAYKIQADLSILKDNLLLSVGSEEDMKISIKKDKQIYTPGEKIDINFSVDSNGKPIVSAIGISIVDQSVYEVKERFTGFEEIHFGLEKEFMSPQYQICNYIFGDGSAIDLPTETIKQFDDETGEGDLVSTTQELSIEAKKLKAQAIESFFAFLALLGIVSFFFLLILTVKYTKFGAIAIVIMLVFLVPIGTVVYYAFQQKTPSGVDSMRTVRSTDVLTPKKEKAALAVGPRIPLDTADYAKKEAEVFPTEKPTYIRKFFPETWFWEPTLITDDKGNAKIELKTPDSITTWGLDAVASTKNAQFSYASENITVFQKFFIEPDIPVSAIRGDIFPLRILVYNYQDKTKNITVELKKYDWFELLSNSTIYSIRLEPNAVGNVTYMINATKVGVHEVYVSAICDELGDAVIREFRVEPDGKKIINIKNGQLDDSQTVEHKIILSENRVENSENAYIILQGGMEAVTMEGAEKFIQFVSGCGEQSTSKLSIDAAAYKNLLKGKPSEEKMFKYETIITQGIQHEMMYLKNADKGRGIVWHHGEKVDLWLTSWALLVFKDLRDSGFDIDERIIEDMHKYIISNKKEDGSYDFPNVGHWSINSELLNKNVAATAYIIRSLLYSGYQKDSKEIFSSIQYLQSNVNLNDKAFTLSLVLIALELGNGDKELRNNIANRIIELKKEENDEVYWTWDDGTQNMNYWKRRGATSIETTAYAIIALYISGKGIDILKKAVKYLLTHRSGGVFFSTHDTAVAFMALNTFGEIYIDDINVEIKSGNISLYSVRFTNENKDLTYLVDLRPNLKNETEIKISTKGKGSLLYQIYYEEYVPWDKTIIDKPKELELTVDYDTTNITINDRIKAHLKLKYNGETDMLKMVLIDLRAPVGFSFDNEEFEGLLANKIINQYEIKGRQALVYIDNVPYGKEVKFDYSLIANMPIKATIQGVNAWDMYNPNLKAEALPVEVLVS